MNHRSKKFLSAIMALVMIVSCLVMPVGAAGSDSSEKAVAYQSVNDLENGVYAKPAAGDLGEQVSIVVKLEGETMYQQTSDLQIAAANADSQLAALARTENRIETLIDESIEVNNRFTLLFNGFSFTGYEWMVDAINTLDGVTAFVDPMFELIEAEEAEVTPSMSMSTGLTGATNAWDLGFTGEGMVVAVVDTGIRGTHEAFSVMPENGRIDKAYLEEVYAEYGSLMHAGSDVDSLYVNEKLPFNYDYFDYDYDPNHTASDHGTHVAGIAAGNNGVDFYGVAPNAQIVTMQVFTDDGGASFSTLMCALEDAAYLGVDAVNMSLGVAAYFTSYESIGSEMEEVYDTLEAAGVAVCAAAGNDAHNSVWNNFGDYFSSRYLWAAYNMDVGTIGAPATFPGSFAVASVVNSSKESGGYLNAYGMDYYPTAIAANPSLGELSGAYEIVYVGPGPPEEIEAAGGVEGKIALTQRGTLTFTDKVVNAANAGAVACLIFNNASGSFNPSISSPIPFGAMTMEDGLMLKDNFTDGVHGVVTVVDEFAYGAVSMASSSSWGTTADLKIKPEIAAPGDGITSSIGFGDDTSYETWSGTSMATPHVAGGMLLIKERLNKLYPDATVSEINNLAYAYMMSTAHQVNGFVRQQGAGLMDLESALTTDAYLTVDGGRPKLELDDSEDGSFTFTFEVTNSGASQKTYSVSASVMTEAVSDLAYSGTVMGNRDYHVETGYAIANPETVNIKTINGTQKNVTSLCDIDAPETVTVAAGETVVVEMTISCNDELMAYFEENCEAGMYLEGFIKLTDADADGVDLSIPFLGFVGDWDYAPMFDLGFWWNLPYGENNLAQDYVAQGTYVGYGVLDQGLGINPYADATEAEYVADRNAISPNGDDLLDGVTYAEFSMMRNPKTVKAYITDAEGNVISVEHDATYSFRKEYYTGSFNGGPTYSYISMDYHGEGLEENETGYVVLEAILDHEEYVSADNMNGLIKIPFTVDTTAPEIKVVDGGIEIIDANYTAYYAVYADAEMTELLYETGVFANERGVAETYACDLDTFYVKTADYARNEATYMVDNGLVYAIDGTFTNTGKTVVARQYIDNYAGYSEYSWASFKANSAVNVEFLTERTYEMNDYAASWYGFDWVSGAVGYDGNVYVNTAESLFILDTETFEVTKVADFYQANGSFCNALNLMTNPETHQMYAYGYSRDLGGNGILELDITTGEMTPLWRITDVPGANQVASSNWAACFVDGNTVAVHGHYGDVAFYDLATGEGFDYIDLNFQNPTYGLSQYGINGVCGTMLYDEDTNCLYLYSNWQWLRIDRYGAQGYVKVDLDTRTTTIHGIADNTLSFHGMYFAEDVKVAPFYTVEQLIAAIGEVDLDDGEAIKAAREAYDALEDSEKALVGNYEDLLLAEHKYAILVAEDASYTAALAYAMLMLEDLENWDTSDWSDHQIADLVALLEQFAADLENATTGKEIVDLMDALLTGVEKIDASCPAKDFDDVDLNAWYHEGVDYVLLNGLMNGIDADTFAPNSNLTRGQLVTVLYRAAGEPDVTGLENPFTDVADNRFFTDAVIWAYNAGIVKGVGNNQFAPNSDITREELVTVLYRYADGSVADAAVLDAYTDKADVSKWAADAMAWAVENGIVTGMTKTTLEPAGATTRAQLAVIFTRMA